MGNNSGNVGFITVLSVVKSLSSCYLLVLTRRVTNKTKKAIMLNIGPYIYPEHQKLFSERDLFPITFLLIHCSCVITRFVSSSFHL